jgi:acetylornithine deacetylase/succinyl-diaminopimelate desuccinylase-like protein
MAAAIARIADLKTPTDLSGASAPKTTYTVGRASCEPPTAPGLGVPSCSLEVDMRSTRKETLEDIRHAIEPTFQAGVSTENARHGLRDGSDEGVSLELMWFGLRPASVAESVDNAAVHAGLQAGLQLGEIKSPMVGTGSGRLNDNVPAHTGVPTYQFTLASSAAGAGGHAFWEWGTRGAPATEGARMHRVLTAALIVAGFHAADGTVVQPSVGPIGQRTREVVR